MYFPMLTRFRTYGIRLTQTVSSYAQALKSLPAVRKQVELASSEPRIRIYDDDLRALGGDPDTVLPVLQ